MNNVWLVVEDRSGTKYSDVPTGPFSTLQKAEEFVVNSIMDETGLSDEEMKSGEFYSRREETEKNGRKIMIYEFDPKGDNDEEFDYTPFFWILEREIDSLDNWNPS